MFEPAAVYRCGEQCVVFLACLNYGWLYTVVPIELTPAGVRRRRRRHRRDPHVSVARVDRTCDAYAAQAVRARKTVGNDAPRFVREVLLG